jgi:hypothetical protein
MSPPSRAGGRDGALVFSKRELVFCPRLVGQVGGTGVI